MANEPDHRIAFDDARKAQVEKEGKPLCDNCDGTGNQFLFMYSKCPKCNGTGIAPYEQLAKAQERK